MKVDFRRGTVGVPSTPREPPSPVRLDRVSGQEVTGGVQLESGV